jgi:DNA-binding transcriptional MerR regulator
MTVSYLPTPVEVDAPSGTVAAMTICRRAGITYRQLDFWSRAGYLHELPRPPHAGSGIPRYYPITELAVATLMGRLSRAGLAPAQAHELARQLLEHGYALLAGIRIDLPTEP